MTEPVRGGDDISARLVITVRDYASTKLPRADVERMFAEALGVTLEDGRSLDERAWIDVPTFERVASTFMAALGSNVIADAFTWAIPLRREHSAMSLTALASPDMFYKHLDRARSFFARHLRFEVYPVEAGVVRVQLHYRPDVPRTRGSCTVARGVLHGVPLLFDLPPAEIVETHCWAEGAPCCTYDVRFRTEAPLALIGVVLSSMVAIVGVLVAPTPWWLVLPAAGWLVGREIYLLRVRRIMTRVSEEHRRMLADNEREFERRYREMQTLNASLEERVDLRTTDLKRAMGELRERNAGLRAAMEDMRALHGELLEAGAERVLDQQALRELEHEINNPLAFVLANLEHLGGAEPERGDLGDLAASVDDIRLGIDRIRSVVAWFVEVHRNAPGQTARFDVTSELRATVKHLERRDGTHLKIDTSLEEVCVPGRGRQLSQVFVNLLENAAEALDGDGEIHVGARRVGDRVLVRVEDGGPGIPGDVLPRIFDRGFSTKSQKNRGLGLYISRQIVERHGGRMTATSAPGKGASFEVDLPLWTEAPSPPPKARARLSSRPD
jgi:signal transduction histidine kinase